MVTDSSGKVCFDADYYPYGQENDYNTSCAPEFRFAGMEYDSETGNYYDHARYYNPRLGRFMSPDPGNAGASPGNPQSWDAYSYVMDNPETLTDPTGRDTYACLKGGKSCVRYDTEQGLIDALNGTGAWLQDGQIFETIGGKTVLVGTFQNLPGPYTERGGMQSANIVNGLFGGIAAGAVDATVNVLSSAVTDIAEGTASAGEAGPSATGEVPSGEAAPPASTPTGVRGGPMSVNGVNADAVVDGVSYSGHALDEMQSEGIMPSAVKDAIENGSRVPTYGNRVAHYGNGVKVITDEAGRVVTAMLQKR